MTTWKTRSEAPRDGTAFLAAFNTQDDPYVTRCHFDRYHGFIVSDDCCGAVGVDELDFDEWTDLPTPDR